MKRIVVLVIMLAVAALAAYFLVANQPVEVSETEQQAQPLAQESPASVGSPPVQQELAEAEARIRSLEEEAAAAKAELEAVKAASVTPAEVEAAPEPEETPEESERQASLDEIRNTIKGNAMAQAQMKALSGLVYGDLLASLNLNAETKEKLRQFLADSQIEQVALAQYAMQQGDIPWSEVREWQEQEQQFLDDQVRTILSDEEYAAWQEYSAQIDEHALDGSLRNQINAFSGGLTPENFDMVMDVAVEEFRAEQVALEQSDTPFTMSENVYYQIRAMDNMRERLQPVLSEDQFAELENFLTMGENVLTSQLPQDDEEALTP